MAEAKVWKSRALVSVSDALVDFFGIFLFPAENDITNLYRHPSRNYSCQNPYRRGPPVFGVNSPTRTLGVWGDEKQYKKLNEKNSDAGGRCPFGSFQTIVSIILR
jgi:hypothetical protein